jgi:stage II sporulation protein E
MSTLRRFGIRTQLLLHPLRKEAQMPLTELSKDYAYAAALLRARLRLLRSMLTAGFPANYALQSVNSLCALRERAGAVTVDLAEIELYTGRVTLYKWGAAPSYAVSPGGVEKIGTPTPPPGLCVDGQQEQVHTLSLRRNQTLVLVSDGVPEDAAEQCCLNHADRSPGELARSLLTCSQLQGQDDATVVTIRLGLARDTDET